MAGAKLPTFPSVPIISYTVLLFSDTLNGCLPIGEAQKIYLKFRDYVPEEVFDALLRQDSQDVLAVRRREITVLFADIQGFTTLATIMPAETWQNDTKPLVKLTRCVLDTQGTLDKYMGDALWFFRYAIPGRIMQIALSRNRYIAMQNRSTIV